MATKSSNVMVRVAPDVKMQAEAVLNKLGIPVSVVINALYHQIIYTNSVPFSMSLPEGIPSLANLSDQQLGAILDDGLSQAKAGLGSELNSVVDKIRRSIN